MRGKFLGANVLKLLYVTSCYVTIFAQTPEFVKQDVVVGILEGWNLFGRQEKSLSRNKAIVGSRFL